MKLNLGSYLLFFGCVASLLVSSALVNTCLLCSPMPEKSRVPIEATTLSYASKALFR
jgi:hypothetical protein